MNENGQYGSVLGAKEGDKGEKTKRPRWQIVTLIVFFMIAFLLVQPCLCHAGAAKASVKSILLLVVLARLMFGLYKNNLTKADFFVWIGVFIGFCYGVEIF